MVHVIYVREDVLLVINMVNVPEIVRLTVEIVLHNQVDAYNATKEK
jgi:hypothetical protein